MTARVIKRMSLAKASIVVFVAVALLTTAFMVKMTQGEALPANPTDTTKVPHYFGPNPNWALSPLTLPDATVTINGDGTGATATALVGAAVGGTGAVKNITITNPGSGYTAATVNIAGAGTGATADATVTTSGSVTAVAVGAPGSGYSAPVVTFTGGGPGVTAQATATAFGGVDAIALGNAGSGYKMPTVDLDAPDDPAGTQARAHAVFDVVTGVLSDIVVDEPGSGYSTAPNVVVRDGTLMDPIRDNPGTGATGTATLKIVSVTLDTFGAGYTAVPTVTIGAGAGTGAGASATATVDSGGVTGITVTANGSGYVTAGGIKKFQDDLPGLCDPAVAGSCPDYVANPNAKYIPLGVPELKDYFDPTGRKIQADEYQIALVQYRSNFSSSMPQGALVRGYVQLETDANKGISQHFPLTNELLDGTKVKIMKSDGVTQWFAVTPPQWLGPTIGATKNKPVRVVFRNLLPIGQKGDLFLPTDSTIMGSGDGPKMPMVTPVNNSNVMDGVRNPVCSEFPKPIDCFLDNRATLHLHGGTSPWISDGTPHQWITPADETTDWPQGVSVRAVPDMTGVDTGPRDGVETFYYTNQQSARLMFYHDHAWGITRLNVYAGEAAGYLIGDDTEKALINSGTIPAAIDTIPLVVQDRTFVPSDAQMYDVKDAAGNTVSYGQDPTWDAARWGGPGSLWYHHVYMPAQNPGDPGGMSAYGRWMYGPWFWPPAAATTYGPIANPYYNMDPATDFKTPLATPCNLDDPATWTYPVDPFCEPPTIPGTPNISAGMEQFNDTPLVNGVAYPKVTLAPKTYRLRMLNAANDRFFNFQWYIADPDTGTLSEVKLNPAELLAAQTDPVVFPTPVQGPATAGPDWIHIGSEGGFLPAPTVVDGQQPTTWITDPTRFDVGNVDLHSLLLAPAERADVIVDFSKFAGKTLILYNDAPAAFPARVPSYDYYTGQPDLSPNGAPGVLPGYGPNTRTIMQVTISGTAAPAFNLTKLRNAFSHKANGSGVFESGQHPIIVGQAAYNSAYGTSFSAASNCNPVPNTPNLGFNICDGLVRVNDTMSFGFNTLKKPTTKSIMALQPKAIHDEMNATTFDEYGRMQANLGVEAAPPTPGRQNGTFYPYVNPSTELIDGTNLPQNLVTYDANGIPVSDLKIEPMSDAADGSQIWRITHNGVDTHPIHFHLFDVQLLNRVTWDNIVIPTEPGELGWKDTIRVAPLEDTIVALRPIVPDLPWEVPNSIHDLNPMDPPGSPKLFNNVDVQGNPTTPITNQLVNFGWEYVYHCHILSHEEMDMMRPVSLAMPPVKADGLSYTLTTGKRAGRVILTWNDNSVTETAFLVQRNDGTGWVDVGTSPSPLDQTNTHGPRSFTDPVVYNPNIIYTYRVVAQNTIGYGGQYPSMTVQSVSDSMATTGTAPATPASLTATPQTGPQVLLMFTDNATDETGFSIQRRINGGAWTALTSLPANTIVNPTTIGPVTFTDTLVAAGNSYDYRVRATKGAAASAWSNIASVDLRHTITPTAGPNGSITPNTTQAVLQGASVTFTITPNSGYHVLDVLVDGVSVGRVTAYPFTNVIANHTISATFEANPTGAFTAPVAPATWFVGSSHPVNWRVAAAVTTGTFYVWAVNQTTGTWYNVASSAAVTGQLDYATNWTVNAPAGTYRLTLWYVTATSPFVNLDYSSAVLTVTTAVSGAFTAPIASAPWPIASSQTVSWHLAAPLGTGTTFYVWAINQTTGTWYNVTSQASVAAQVDYGTNWTVNVPAGTYRLTLWYVTATSPLINLDYSRAVLTVL